MKKQRAILTSTVLSAILLTTSVPALAHPGRTDSDGGHTCRTNCEKWCLQPSKYHYHNADGSVRRVNEQPTEQESSTPEPAQTWDQAPSPPPAPAWQPANVKVKLDDQEPVTANGRTLVPMRRILESLGAQLSWDQPTQSVTATKDGVTILLTVGSKTAYKNGTPVTLDQAPLIVNGRTVVPARFVVEAFNGDVKWDDATRTVYIFSPGRKLGILKHADKHPDKVVTVPPTEPGNKMAYVHFIDVGQADSIYIQLPNHNDILIDGGNRADGQKVVDYLKAQGVDDLEAVIATHPHEDHIGGLPDVLQAYQVDSFYMPNAVTTTRTFEDLLIAVKENHAKTIVAKAGMKLEVPGAEEVILAPEIGDSDDLNNSSVVLKLNYGQTSFLFTGDAENLSEVQMLSNGYDVSADVLKVGHHGSQYSTSKGFLDNVKPKYAVISVGAGNEYGHPAESTLKLLQDAGVPVYRTDKDGTVVVTTDGASIFMSTQK
ncbi:MBL fold metallo-hydrolase [Heliobacillus mobilis]|uniref:MBL fold metallo-hydrolase n=1 Tax=Heliobacterium mobile TaxID=28064 RepID=A0A6I3SFB7_HELMO|nr:stalk domain-containing protein [Heliobacterium mobile]MTV47720.1 MBL fold metallo-hydrolase [Heliobacterium mobile]